MQRAPEVNMSEREFRRSRRRAMNTALESLETLNEHANLLPEGTSRKIRGAMKTLQNVRGELVEWWGQY